MWSCCGTYESAAPASVRGVNLEVIITGMVFKAVEMHELTYTE